uniref:Bacterial bifunctional deaminase-reductase C-terminal domain-containing protein n=1 Tax=Magnetococcus massalia (strain MO-1) TaxID=451514 RepID=A0A1S7LFC0_MAGMO|nr:conserved protein of unknown function [include conserved C-terminus domain of the bifunctional deaminase-reductase] [Candidatus Magnetococcus massalia]
MSNSVFIATSLDGYIADKQGGLDWLHSIPNPEKRDLGFVAFMQSVDALVMGRNTFEVVCGFECDWPYDKPVFVLSNSLREIPSAYSDKATLMQGTPHEVVEKLDVMGLSKRYIDGGITIQRFLQAGLIDEMTITQLPILLGGGSPLFGKLNASVDWELVSSRIELNAMVQSHYRRRGSPSLDQSG